MLPAKSDQHLCSHIFIKDVMCVTQVRVLQLKQEQEKCRVLEEALNVLAKEHHELEQSMASHLSVSPLHHERRYSSTSSPRSPRFYDTSDDEFYDAFEAGIFITSVIITLQLQIWNERGCGKELWYLLSFIGCGIYIYIYRQGEQIFLTMFFLYFADRASCTDSW